MKRPPPRRRLGVPAMGAAVVLLAAAAWWLADAPEGADSVAAHVAKPAPRQQAQVPCHKLLGCAAGLAIEDAGKLCAPQIEELAAFTPRWTNRARESIFIDFMWLQEDRGTITFLGRNAEFQDAGGRYTPVAYECDFDPAARQVLNVRVMTAGR